MKFYLCSKNEKNRELTLDEVRKYLTDKQIQEGIDAKYDDPDEEVSYMATGGIILITL